MRIYREDSGKRKKITCEININYSWCKKCGICIAFCPTGVYKANDFGAPVINHLEKCVNCQLCVMYCPDFAIEVNKKQ